MPWVSSVKYLGVYVLCNSGKNEYCLTTLEGSMDSSITLCQYYIGKGRNEITAIHLLKAYCLPTLMYSMDVRTSVCVIQLNVKLTLSGIIAFVIFFMLLARQCETFAVLLSLSATFIPY